MRRTAAVHPALSTKQNAAQRIVVSYFAILKSKYANTNTTPHDARNIGIVNQPIKHDAPTNGSASANSATVALAIPRDAHHDPFIEGIYNYTEENGCNWSFFIAPESLSLSLLNLVGWDGDGVIAALTSPEESDCAAHFHLPIVNTSSALAKSPVPRSIVDNYAVGELAAEHLLERGFHNFAFYGMSDVAYSRLRFDGFVDTLTTVGFAASDLMLASTFQLRSSSWLKQQNALQRWLASLETPCGVFAVSDARARQVGNCCKNLAICVPDQIAVIGVDDQQMICDHVHPTISSIARDYKTEGYQAASLLDQLMRRAKGQARDQLIPPLRVVTRESTTTFAVPDERLRKVMVYIRNRIDDEITIDSLCQHAMVSRRWLEYSFRETLGESPFQYLQRQRLEVAERLLREEPKTKILSIANRTGFSSRKQFSKVFRREFGISPRVFRQSVECTNGTI